MDASGFALPPGSLLGNYKLLKALGQGGFGITYIAWDSQLRRNIVLKECFPLGLCSRDSDTGEIIPLPHTSRQAYRTAMDSLRKEAQTLASLNHERIVRVYDVFESHGSIFYVMPWLEGGSLRERMDEAAKGARAMTTEQIAEWLPLLLDGLDYLHGKGIYHRDIKPGNILFDERELPVLIDFGAALNKPEVTCTITQGEFSYAYASPEQITGKGEIGPWTDFYALAATWYELISGIPAEPADKRLMRDDVAPLSGMAFPQSWPRDLLASIDRNLRLKPEERCQTAGQWKECLEQGKPVKLRKGNLRKNTLIVASLGLLVVIIILGMRTVNRPSIDRQDLPEQEVNSTRKETDRSPQELKNTEAPDQSSQANNTEEQSPYQTLLSKARKDLQIDKWEQDVSAKSSQYWKDLKKFNETYPQHNKGKQDLSMGLTIEAVQEHVNRSSLLNKIENEKREDVNRLTALLTIIRNYGSGRVLEFEEAILGGRIIHRQRGENQPPPFTKDELLYLTSVRENLEAHVFEFWGDAWNINPDSDTSEVVEQAE